MTQSTALTGSILQSPRSVFLEHAEAGELAYQVAVPSGDPVFFPRVASPVDGGELEWRVSAGSGAVYATTIVRPRGASPHNVSLIELDEGFRLMSAVTDIDPERVHVGLRVSVRFAQLEPDGPLLPVFVPEEES